jgi:hypothetical protein
MTEEAWYLVCYIIFSYVFVATHIAIYNASDVSFEFKHSNYIGFFVLSPIIWPLIAIEAYIIFVRWIVRRFLK